MKIPRTGNNLNNNDLRHRKKEMGKTLTVHISHDKRLTSEEENVVLIHFSYDFSRSTAA